MAMESTTYIFFKNGQCVKLIHYSNNLYAAKKAMLSMYGKSESDISHTGSKSNIPYQTFDGRDYH